MNFASWLNEETRKMDWIDMALTKVSCFAFGVLLAILIPQLTEINILWIIAVWILLAIRPVYRFFK